MILWLNSGSLNNQPGMVMGTKKNAGQIIQGRTSNGIDYYHCSSGEVGNKEEEDKDRHLPHLMLLHGARFTKEDWKTSGILQQFCNPSLSVVNGLSQHHGVQQQQQQLRGLQVSAMDLPVSATPQDFIAMVQAFHREVSTSVLPLAGLVTPSASGKVITDAILQQRRRGTDPFDAADDEDPLKQLAQYIQRWIPVAAGSVQQLQPDELKRLKESNIEVLAIYGNKDAMGKQTTSMLQQWAGATAVELVGGHPCYLDSPDEFVKVVLQSLGRNP
jgi:hypothetical protein